MQILAIDVGARRIGLATGESALGIAFAKENMTLSSEGKPAEIFPQLLKFVRTEKIQKIIVGHPGALDRLEQEQVKRCRDFADDLEDFLLKNNCAVEVEFIDETLSSVIAERQLQSMGRSTHEQKGEKDALAAAAFLQGYFERQKEF